MQKTNRIFYRNNHINFLDEGEDERGNPIRPIRALFRPVDLAAAQFLKVENEIWILFKPHDNRDCVIGYKRVKIVSIERTKGSAILAYQTYEHRDRSPDDVVAIVRGENTSQVYTLPPEREGALENLAKEKAIYIGPH